MPGTGSPLCSVAVDRSVELGMLERADSLILGESVSTTPPPPLIVLTSMFAADGTFKCELGNEAVGGTVPLRPPDGLGIFDPATFEAIGEVKKLAFPRLRLEPLVDMVVIIEFRSLVPTVVPLYTDPFKRLEGFPSNTMLRRWGPIMLPEDGCRTWTLGVEISGCIIGGTTRLPFICSLNSSPLKCFVISATGTGTGSPIQDWNSPDWLLGVEDDEEYCMSAFRTKLEWAIWLVLFEAGVRDPECGVGEDRVPAAVGVVGILSLDLALGDIPLILALCGDAVLEEISITISVSVLEGGVKTFSLMFFTVTAVSWLELSEWLETGGDEGRVWMVFCAGSPELLRSVVNGEPFEIDVVGGVIDGFGDMGGEKGSLGSGRVCTACELAAAALHYPPQPITISMTFIRRDSFIFRKEDRDSCLSHKRGKKRDIGGSSGLVNLSNPSLTFFFFCCAHMSRGACIKHLEEQRTVLNAQCSEQNVSIALTKQICLSVYNKNKSITSFLTPSSVHCDEKRQVSCIVQYPCMWQYGTDVVVDFGAKSLVDVAGTSPEDGLGTAHANMSGVSVADDVVDVAAVVVDGDVIRGSSDGIVAVFCGSVDSVAEEEVVLDVAPKNLAPVEE
ncbi:hypothetical protein BCR41DRAFT_373132 [Lobosporangium transversale]|uniref:Uncharacterized protein n=1 Tax=Lobosporangium transversale TaxID=64571 RepID=A0A1Y2GEV3_9FUNG|nr:hypothetical protein BCR41DRAFT_373132 [Lobosporangium transversale]ORZ08831.1 hypothetical protein BCR41DRAFT_373132 [Lobosporangium transversale]|eukprot:XP_021878614.1 hypothetical protein BCR41DRAFT_373132 [Lobosporangium transversale]